MISIKNSVIFYDDLLSRYKIFVIYETDHFILALILSRSFIYFIYLALIFSSVKVLSFISCILHSTLI